jgi:catechol 2,3-dioxygenase-like lactoylglutathione lyase family enzyme
MENGFSAGQIDHVELFVPDRYEAAHWYRRALGLEIMRNLEDWAAADGGPLMISGDGGNSMLALFEGQPRGSRETAGHHRVAFRVDGPTFLSFLERLKRFPVFDEEGRESSSARVVDHDRAYSAYFCDPYGNRYEVTTYDYEEVANHLSASWGEQG